jgi:hypothetical protein
LYCQLLSAQTFNKSDSRVWLYAPKSWYLRCGWLLGYVGLVFIRMG